MKPKIQIVDKDDNLIGTKYREEVDEVNDINRISTLWVTNSKNEVLIAQRKFTKARDPGKWSCAVAGTVEEGETYESNIYKEAAEEIGLTGQKFTVGPKQFPSGAPAFFMQWYFCVIDKPVEEFVIQEDEVEQLAWIKKDDLVKDVNQNPEKYVPLMPSILKVLKI